MTWYESSSPLSDFRTIWLSPRELLYLSGVTLPLPPILPLSWALPNSSLCLYIYGFAFSAMPHEQIHTIWSICISSLSPHLMLSSCSIYLVYCFCCQVAHSEEYSDMLVHLASGWIVSKPAEGNSPFYILNSYKNCFPMWLHKQTKNTLNCIIV